MSGAPIFDAAALRKQCESLLNTVPPGHGCARVKFTFPDGTVSVEVIERFNEHLAVGGSVAWNIPKHAVGATAELVASW